MRGPGTKSYLLYQFVGRYPWIDMIILYINSCWFIYEFIYTMNKWLDEFMWLPSQYLPWPRVRVRERVKIGYKIRVRFLSTWTKQSTFRWLRSWLKTREAEIRWSMFYLWAALGVDPPARAGHHSSPSVQRHTGKKCWRRLLKSEVRGQLILLEPFNFRVAIIATVSNDLEGLSLGRLLPGEFDYFCPSQV